MGHRSNFLHLRAGFLQHGGGLILGEHACAQAGRTARAATAGSVRTAARDARMDRNPAHAGSLARCAIPGIYRLAARRDAGDFLHPVDIFWAADATRSGTREMAAGDDLDRDDWCVCHRVINGLPAKARSAVQTNGYTGTLFPGCPRCYPGWSGPAKTSPTGGKRGPYNDRSPFQMGSSGIYPVRINTNFRRTDRFIPGERNQWSGICELVRFPRAAE